MAEVNQISVDPNDNLTINLYWQDTSYHSNANGYEAESTPPDSLLAKMDLSKAEPCDEYMGLQHEWQTAELDANPFIDPMAGSPAYRHTGEHKDFFWRPTNSATASFSDTTKEEEYSPEATSENFGLDMNGDIPSSNFAAATGDGPPTHDSGSSSPSERSSRGNRNARARTARGKRKRKTTRSQLGCLTCRQKKKGCDQEFKVRTDFCNNTARKCNRCYKSGLLCYSPEVNEKWHRGANRDRTDLQKAAKDVGIYRFPIRGSILNESVAAPSSAPLSMTSRNLPFCIQGITLVDVELKLIDYFWYNTSKIMSMRAAHSNPFLAVLLPMGVKHEGLMHAVLWMAAFHMSRDNGRQHCEQDNDKLKRLIVIHHEAARRYMVDITSRATQGMRLNDHELALLIVYSRKLTFSQVEGDETYRSLLNHIFSIVQGHCFDNAAFMDFAQEFVLYYGTLNAVTTMSEPQSPILPETVNWPVVPRVSNVVFDDNNTLLEDEYLKSICKLINKITYMRNIIRPRWVARERYAVNNDVFYTSTCVGKELADKIRQWEDLPNHLIPSLYACYAYVFLMRTVRESYPSPELSAVVDLTLDHLEVAMQRDDFIGIALPFVFMIGCASFKDSHYLDLDGFPKAMHVGQRTRVKAAFIRLKQQRNMPDTDRAFHVVRKVWEMMDSDKDEDVISSWHWEEIMQRENIQGPFV